RIYCPFFEPTARAPPSLSGEQLRRPITERTLDMVVSPMGAAKAALDTAFDDAQHCLATLRIRMTETPHGVTKEEGKDLGVGFLRRDPFAHRPHTLGGGDADDMKVLGSLKPNCWHRVVENFLETVDDHRILD